LTTASSLDVKRNIYLKCNESPDLKAGQDLAWVPKRRGLSNDFESEDDLALQPSDHIISLLSADFKWEGITDREAIGILVFKRGSAAGGKNNPKNAFCLFLQNPFNLV
jgi:hypothetical protein